MTRLATFLVALTLAAVALSQPRAPEVVKVPRLVAIGDLAAGDYFCDELTDDVWYVCYGPGNPDDYPASNYYGVEQPAPRVDVQQAVNLNTGKAFLWARGLKVRPVIDARVIVRVHEP